MKSNLTTLCYIEQDEKYLMMHRVKKENDINKDKWVGVGGHFEKDESPEECLIREVKEETNLDLKSFRLRGVITFLSDRWQTEYMFLYTAEVQEETIGECDEGDLEWIEKKKVYELPIWEGDKIFFRLLEEERGFFSLKLRYVGEELVEAVLDGENISERSVRNCCAKGRVPGAFLTGKTWNIPENAEKPERSNKRKEKTMPLLEILREEKANKYSGGIYHKTQIELTYNSNHMEGSRLTHDQTRYIFETNTVGVENEILNVDDVIETANHFRCIDRIIEKATATLTENFIKELHLILKNGTSDSRKDRFAVGDYKKLPNEVGGMDTALPEEVADRMNVLLAEYNSKEKKTLNDILDFHVKFEKIHPFQDGNGRVGRLILFKECLKYQIVPFIIEDNLKLYYYRGLKEWDREKGYLTDTCLTAQDRYKAYLDYFRIPYEE